MNKSYSEKSAAKTDIPQPVKENNRPEPKVKPQSLPFSANEQARSEKVFVVGQIGYDFGTEAQLDYFTQIMGGKDSQPFDPVQMANHLTFGHNIEQSSALTWTVKIDAVPIFAIQPENQFVIHQYARLVEFLHDQETAGVERISLAGTITGETYVDNAPSY